MQGDDGGAEEETKKVNLAIPVLIRVGAGYRKPPQKFEI
jgi:hypothetical protein